MCVLMLEDFLYGTTRLLWEFFHLKWGDFWRKKEEWHVKCVLWRTPNSLGRGRLFMARMEKEKNCVCETLLKASVSALLVHNRTELGGVLRPHRDQNPRRFCLTSPFVAKHFFFFSLSKKGAEESVLHSYCIGVGGGSRRASKENFQFIKICLSSERLIRFGFGSLGAHLTIEFSFPICLMEKRKPC